MGPHLFHLLGRITMLRLMRKVAIKLIPIARQLYRTYRPVIIGAAISVLEDAIAYLSKRAKIIREAVA